MMMGTGQLSLMIIVGLLILVVIGLGYFLVGTAQERAGPSAQEVQVGRDLVTPVKGFIDGCLRVSSVGALQTLAKQGGVLYVSQGGVTPDNDIIEGETVLMVDGVPVSYGIYAPQGQVGNLYFSELPAYPWSTFPYYPLSTGSMTSIDNVEHFEGFFGMERLPQLNGSDERSMEKTLVAAIQSQVDTCLDWSKLGAPVNVTDEPAQVSVAFNDADVTIILNVSARVISNDNTVDARIQSSVLRLPVRLRRIYDAAKLVLGRNVKDITSTVDFAQDGIITKLVRNVSRPDGKAGDDMIIFIDNKGRLEGAPYEFRVLRQDRPPALFYTKTPTTSEINLCCGATIRRNDLTVDYDRTDCVTQGSGSFPSKPFTAMDPDNDTVSIEILTSQRILGTSALTIQSLAPSIDLVVRACEEDRPLVCDEQIVPVPNSVVSTLPSCVGVGS